MKFSRITKQIKNALINQLTNTDNLLASFNISPEKIEKNYNKNNHFYKFNNIENVLIYATKKKHVEVIKAIVKQGYDLTDVAHELIMQGICTHSLKEIDYLLKIDKLNEDKIERYINYLVIGPDYYNGSLEEFKLLAPYIVQYRQENDNNKNNHPLEKEINKMIERSKFNSSDYAININYINENCRGMIEAISESSSKLSTKLLNWVMIKGHFTLLETILNNAPKEEKCDIEQLIFNAAERIKLILQSGIARSIFQTGSILPEEYFQHSISILLKNYYRSSSQDEDFSKEIFSKLAETNQDDILQEMLNDNYFNPIKNQAERIKEIFFTACQYGSFNVINSLSHNKNLSSLNLHEGLDILITQEEDMFHKRNQMKSIECLIMMLDNVDIPKEKIMNTNLISPILELVEKKKLQYTLNHSLDIQENKASMKL